MKTLKTVELMTFDELNPEAKETARQWWLECQDNSFAWENIQEDAKNIGLKIASLDDCRANSGGFVISAIECSENILNDHGESCETYKIAKAFQDAIDALPDTSDENDNSDVIEELEDSFLHDLLEDYRIMLNKDIEYQQSDEYVDDTILANEYTFTADGKRMD